MSEIILDLESAPLEELLKNHALLEKVIAKRRQDTKKEAAQKIKELAKTYQLDLDSLLKEKEEKSVTKVKPKYQHPDRPDLQWTGRGRQPTWVAELLASGRTLDSLLIDAEKAA